MQPKRGSVATLEGKMPVTAVENTQNNDQIDVSDELFRSQRWGRRADLSNATTARFRGYGQHADTSNWRRADGNNAQRMVGAL
jgi:hypothetical protein